MLQDTFSLIFTSKLWTAWHQMWLCAVTFCLALVFSVTNYSIKTNSTWHNPGRQQIMNNVIYSVIFDSVLDAKADIHLY